MLLYSLQHLSYGTNLRFYSESNGEDDVLHIPVKYFSAMKKREYHFFFENCENLEIMEILTLSLSEKEISCFSHLLYPNLHSFIIS